MNADGKIVYKVVLDDRQLQEIAQQVVNRFKRISSTAQQEGDKMQAVFAKLQRSVGAYFSLRGVQAFATQIVRVRGEIQALEVSFRTLLGSQEASAELMHQMKDFAASTPLQLGDLAKAAQTMLGFNVAAEEIMPMLKAIGDISMGDAQKFQSLSLAFSQMRSVGKLMGQDLLQMINAGFNPLVVIAEQTGRSIGQLKEEMAQGAISAEAVTQAFLDATREGGKFHGMLENQGSTVRGAIAQLQGALTDMFNGIGEQSEGIIKGSVKSLQWLAQNYETVGKVIAGLVVTYGVHRASLMADIAVTRIATLQTKGFTTAQILLHDATKRLTIAQKALNKTMRANLYTLAAMAVIGLCYGIYKLATAETEAEKAQRRHNDELERGKKKIEEYQQAVENYLSVIKDDTATQLKRQEAYEALIKLMPQLKGMSMDDIASMGAEDLDKLKNRNADIIHYQDLKKNVEKAKKAVQDAQKALDDARNAPVSADGLSQTIERATAEKRLEGAREQLKLAEADLRAQDELQKRAEWEALSQENKVASLNKQLESLKEQQSVYTAQLPLQARQLVAQGKIAEAIKLTTKEAGGFTGNLFSAWTHVINIGKAIDKVNGQLKRVQNQGGGKTYKQALSEAKKEYDDAKKALKQIKQSTKAKEEEYRKAQARLDKAKSAYESLGGNTSTSSNTNDRSNKQAEERRRLKQYEDSKKAFERQQTRQEIDNAFAIEQQKIEIEKDGLAKELALAQLKTKRLKEENRRREEDMIDSLQRQKASEWEAKNPEKVKQGYSYQGHVTREDLPKIQQKQLEENNRLITEQGLKDESDIIAKHLQQFETYHQQRARIIKEYKQKEEDLYTTTPEGEKQLRQGVTQENIDELNRQKEETLKQVDETWAEKQDAYQQWLQEIAYMSLAQLEQELTKVTALLATAEAGGADEKTLARLRTQVATLTKKLKELQRQSHSTEQSFADWSRLTESLRGTKAEIENIAGEVEGFSPKLGKVLRAVGGLATPVISAIGSIGKFAEMTQKGVSKTATSTQKAIALAEKGTLILSIISATIQVITRVAELFNQDKMHEEKIKGIDAQIAQLQWRIAHLGFENFEQATGKPLEHVSEILDRVAEQTLQIAKNTGDATDLLAGLESGTLGVAEAGHYLAEAYAKADYMANKAFGNDRYTRVRQELELMGQQIANIERQKREEEAKKRESEEKKKEKLDEYSRKQKELAEQMAGRVDKIFSDLLGGDAFALADKLGNALFDAFSKGEDAAKAFGSTVDDIVRNMVKKLLIQQFLEKPLQEAINKLKKKAQENGGLSIDSLTEGVSDIYSELNKLGASVKGVPEAYKRLLNALGIDPEDDRTGGKKGIANASQDSIDELNGRATAIQTHTAQIAEGTARLVSFSSATLDYVADIARLVKEGNASRQRIELSTTTLATKIRDLETTGIKTK